MLSEQNYDAATKSHIDAVAKFLGIKQQIVITGQQCFKMHYWVSFNFLSTVQSMQLQSF